MDYLWLSLIAKLLMSVQAEMGAAKAACFSNTGKGGFVGSQSSSLWDGSSAGVLKA